MTGGINAWAISNFYSEDSDPDLMNYYWILILWKLVLFRWFTWMGLIDFVLNNGTITTPSTQRWGILTIQINTVNLIFWLGCVTNAN